MNKKLTICYLSYQRIPLLLKNLNLLINWLKNYKYKSFINIYIFDNNSDDFGTLQNFVNQNTDKVDCLKLYSSKINKGFPSNLTRAINGVESYYTWLFSDDDFINFSEISSLLDKSLKYHILFHSCESAINQLNTCVVYKVINN